MPEAEGEGSKIHITIKEANRMQEPRIEGINEFSRSMKGYRRAARVARILSWGHTAALGVAAASLAIGGLRVARALRK